MITRARPLAAPARRCPNGVPLPGPADRDRVKLTEPNGPAKQRSDLAVIAQGHPTGGDRRLHVHAKVQEAQPAPRPRAANG